MSDLTATNCGCNNNSCGCGNNNGFGGSCIWLIFLLFFCNGNNSWGNSCGNGCGNGILGGNNGNSCCDWLIWILLISCFCGNGCGNSCGCSNC